MSTVETPSNPETIEQQVSEAVGGAIIAAVEAEKEKVGLNASETSTDIEMNMKVHVENQNLEVKDTKETVNAGMIAEGIVAAETTGMLPATTETIAIAAPDGNPKDEIHVSFGELIKTSQKTLETLFAEAGVEGVKVRITERSPDITSTPESELFLTLNMKPSPKHKQSGLDIEVTFPETIQHEEGQVIIQEVIGKLEWVNGFYNGLEQKKQMIDHLRVLAGDKDISLINENPLAGLTESEVNTLLKFAFINNRVIDNEKDERHQPGSHLVTHIPNEPARLSWRFVNNQSDYPLNEGDVAKQAEASLLERQEAILAEIKSNAKLVGEKAGKTPEQLQEIDNLSLTISKYAEDEHMGVVSLSVGIPDATEKNPDATAKLKPSALLNELVEMNKEILTHAATFADRDCVDAEGKPVVDTEGMPLKEDSWLKGFAFLADKAQMNAHLNQRALQLEKMNPALSESLRDIAAIHLAPMPFADPYYEVVAPDATNPSYRIFLQTDVPVPAVIAKEDGTVDTNNLSTTYLPIKKLDILEEIYRKSPDLAKAETEKSSQTLVNNLEKMYLESPALPKAETWKDRIDEQKMLVNASSKAR